MIVIMLPSSDQVVLTITFIKITMKIMISITKMTGETPEVRSDKRYPKDIPKTSQRYPKDIPKISQKYPKDIPKTSQRYPKDIPKISQRYPKDIPKIS